MNTNEWAMRGSALYARLMNKETFWTFEDPWGEISENDYKTRGDAVIAANNDFCQYCDENEEDCVNGATREEECLIYQYVYNSQGDRICVGFREITVEWEYYHGDQAEHGTWHSGAGGVI